MKRSLLFAALVVFFTTAFMSVVGCNNQNLTKEQPSVPEKSSADWAKLYTDKNGDMVFYKIENSVKNVVQVWGKRVFSDEGRNEFIQDRVNNGLSIIQMEKLGYFNSLYEIECKNKRDRVLSVVIYDIDGKVILADSFSRSEWAYVVPDSIGDSFRKAVCP